MSGNPRPLPHQSRAADLRAQAAQRLNLGALDVRRLVRTEKCMTDTPLLRLLKADSARHPAWVPGPTHSWCYAPQRPSRQSSNLASVNATLASAIESTIESRVSRLLRGDLFEKTSGA